MLFVEVDGRACQVSCVEVDGRTGVMCRGLVWMGPICNSSKIENKLSEVL